MRAAPCIGTFCLTPIRPHSVLCISTFQVQTLRQAPTAPPDLTADVATVLSRCLLFPAAERLSVGEIKASLAQITIVEDQVRRNIKECVR